MPSPEVSVILPLYNEEENVGLLHDELKRALDALERPYEIIYVDDGSGDASAPRLRALAAGDPTVTVIRLRRNYGQTAALSAGIDHSRGEIIVLMDADLQNDPADIGRLLDVLDEGYDVVSGWRADRQDAFITRTLPSKAANALISRVTGVHLHDYGCTLKAYRREVLASVRLYGEMQRFGKSKYGLTRILRVLLDLVTVKFLGTYSTKPHYVFGFIGMLLGLVSIGCEAVAGFQALTPPYVRMHNNPLTLLGAICLVLAVQIILMGLLAELIMRTYHESQGKTTYLIRSLTTAPAASGGPAADAADEGGATVSAPQPAPMPVSVAVPAVPTPIPAQHNGHNGHSGHIPGEWRGADGQMAGKARIAG
jgi:Glycosyl transferase family 2